MTLQRSLNVLPPEARIVSPRLAILLDDEQLVAFSASDPIYQCRRDDREAMRLAGAMFSTLRLASVTALSKALGVSRETIYRNRRQYAEGGAEGLLHAPRSKTPHKLTAGVQRQAQQRLDEGWPVRRIAEEVGLTEGALRLAIGRGQLHRRFTARPGRPSKHRVLQAETPASPSQRAEEDQACEQGVAVKRTVDRVLASVGKLGEAAPEFQAVEAVPGAGVLLALPALLDQGLVEVPQRLFGALRNGFFGLRSVLLTLAFMALLRIKSPEQLTGHAPGELGLLLGLDRVPEVKTLRRKLAEMGGRGLARLLHQHLTERWARDEPEHLGLLYLDGHVRPYHGRKHTLPKHHVQQRNRPMPGTQDFHVNDDRADPLFLVTAEATEGLITMMDEHLLPEIRRLVGPQRRVTVVFDREGWSPESFARWKDQGFDVITYRKAQQSRWQERFFAKVTRTVDGRKVSYRLAERRVTLANGLRVREVRRLTDDGHQTAVITTNESLSMFQVAHRMFSRWRQENFFRYMRHEFAVDHLCTYAVEPADPERVVPHPERKRLEQQIRTAQTALGRLTGRRGDLTPGKSLRVNGRTMDEDDLDEELRQQEESIRRLQARRDVLSKEVALDRVLDAKDIVQLERERKLLTDAVKMIAYRAESYMARWVEPFFARHEDEARKLLQSVFQATADLLPDAKEHTLTVRFHGLSTPRATRALSDLCEIFTAEEVRYPGTDLRLRFEAPECHTN